MKSNEKQLTATSEMLTAVVRHLSIKWLLFVFYRFEPFDFVSENIGIPRKQNSLFPSRPAMNTRFFCISLLVPPPGRGVGTPVWKVLDAHWKIYIKPLKQTNLGETRVFILLWNGNRQTAIFLKVFSKDTMTHHLIVSCWTAKNSGVSSRTL